jgi:hypothetical protein
MSNIIPKGIQRQHLLEAIHKFDKGVQHQFAESTGYDVLHEGRRYPPKAIVGIAAEILTGNSFGPYDFKGGVKSKCFQILEKNGFHIVPKLEEEISAWILQGNPTRFDMDDYLARYSFVYWSAPQLTSKMRIGDPVFFWRAGKMAGVVADGIIAELPCERSRVIQTEALGEDLWTNKSDEPTTIKVGVQLGEVRLSLEEGMVSRQLLMKDPIFSLSKIIKSPQGTVFHTTKEQHEILDGYWNKPESFFLVENDDGASEGALRLRKHKRRERSRYLVELKKAEVFKEKGRLVCQGCNRGAEELYPPGIGDDFFEVHHLIPLSKLNGVVRTTTKDLALVCANCHRIIHRSVDAEGNFHELVGLMEGWEKL